MIDMHALIKRHIKCYLRDRWAVFFSFLSVFIILMLFVFFLGSYFEDIGQQAGIDDNLAAYIVYGWVFSGLLMVSSVTIPLGFLARMVEDKNSRALHDFQITPLKRYKIVLSYLIAAVIVTLMLNALNLVIGLGILFLNSGEIVPLFNLIQVIALMLLIATLFSGFFFFLLSFFKSENAHGTFSTLVGTLIGFLGGLYVPIGALSTTIQNIINALPFMQAAALLRQVYMAEALDLAFGTNEAARENYTSFYGVELTLFNQSLSTQVLLLILLVFTLLILMASIWRMRHLKIA